MASLFLTGFGIKILKRDALGRWVDLCGREVASATGWERRQEEKAKNAAVKSPFFTLFA